MKRSLAIAVRSTVLLMLFGSWTVARATPVDFAFFDGTNPATEAPPFGGAECIVSGAATLHASVTAHSSGPDGFVRLTYQDGDFVQFPIASNGTLQLTQAIGGTFGVDRRIRLSNGGDSAGARLVGSLSAISLSTFGTVTCISCKFDDPAGDQGPQIDCHN